VNWSGYYWTLVECEAKELPKDGEPMELSMWSGKRNNKIDKWGKGDGLVLVEVFRKGRLDFLGSNRSS
jgi:hypothetical protein